MSTTTMAGVVAFDLTTSVADKCLSYSITGNEEVTADVHNCNEVKTADEGVINTVMTPRHNDDSNQL